MRKLRGDAIRYVFAARFGLPVGERPLLSVHTFRQNVQLSEGWHSIHLILLEDMMTVPAKCHPSNGCYLHP